MEPSLSDTAPQRALDGFCSYTASQDCLHDRLAMVGPWPEQPGGDAPCLPQLPHLPPGLVLAHEHGSASDRAAIQFCIEAANALLGAARQLAEEPPHLLPPKERAQRVKALIHETKVAGRAAYRAALTLAGQEWKEE
ncbi:hypothetical protein [Variovorax soli]|uniref:Uncharacterized protein n=1 Tax=Variovorax soli TaxID=376815 RepID=A0ABU1NKR8_9BURK|nr:hypothetical protein [Variovorax soli]MDR6539044.1 hypothetical protein [Variovorax soli]